MRNLRKSCVNEMNAASSPPIVADFTVSAVMKQLGGKIVVSGIGSREEDEFLLNLLNEQVNNISFPSFQNYYTFDLNRV